MHSLHKLQGSYKPCIFFICFLYRCLHNLASHFSDSAHITSTYFDPNYVRTGRCVFCIIFTYSTRKHVTVHVVITYHRTTCVNRCDWDLEYNNALNLSTKRASEFLESTRINFCTIHATSTQDVRGSKSSGRHIKLHGFSERKATSDIVQNKPIWTWRDWLLGLRACSFKLRESILPIVRGRE